MTRQFLISLSIISLGLVVSRIVAADEPSDAIPSKPKSENRKSLDDQLLDDLSSELLDGLGDIPSKSIPKKGATPKGDAPKGDAPQDQPGDQKDPTARPLDQVGQGEDVEFGQESDPLTRIGKKMRTVENLMGQKQTSSRTQGLQKEILDDLTALIEFEKTQCAKCKGSSNSKPGQPLPGTSAAKDPSRPQQSTERVEKGQVNPDEIVTNSEFIKEIWGELPERFVQQMQSAGIERFLPKYEKLIEDYYKRLAEEREDYP